MFFDSPSGQITLMRNLGLKTYKKTKSRFDQIKTAFLCFLFSISHPKKLNSVPHPKQPYNQNQQQ